MASKAAPGGGTVGSYQRQAIEAYLATQPPDTPIAAVVASRDVEERIGAFERADVAAVEHQTSYRRMYRFALWTTTVGAITGALSLLPVGDGLTLALKR